jgi:hypothetical protein
MILEELSLFKNLGLFILSMAFLEVGSVLRRV